MIEEIVRLLKEKNELLKQAESISAAMNVDDIDELVTLDEARNNIVEELKKLDERVKLIYENSPQADSISRAIYNQEDYALVPDELKPIYDSSKENFKIVAHLLTFQDEYNQHLAHLMETLQDDMKENQKSGKVAKYLKALDDQVIPAGSVLSKANRKA